MKWEELSISDRSNLMKTYLQNGVIQLSDMRDHYNKFADGGNLFKNGGKTSFLDKVKRGVTKLLGEYLYYTEVPDISTESVDPREIKEKLIAPFRPITRPIFMGPYKRDRVDSLSEAYWKRYLTDSDTTKVATLPSDLKSDIGNWISNTFSDPDSYEANKFFGDKDWELERGVISPSDSRINFYKGSSIPVEEYHVYPEYKDTGELTPASALGHFQIRLIDDGEKAVVTDRYDFTPNDSDTPTDKDEVRQPKWLRSLRRTADKVFYPFPIRDTVDLPTPIKLKTYSN